MIGTMRERIVVQQADPVSRTISTLTSTGTTATATTSGAHGYTTGDYVTVSGATPSGYNGRVQVTVTGTTTFTYTMALGLTTPATGTKRVIYTSDHQGGRKQSWHEVGRMWAELVPGRASERIQAQGMGSQHDYQFKVRRRTDIAPAMQAVWSPSFPPGAAEVTLEIRGVPPWQDGRTFMMLDCSVRT